MSGQKTFLRLNARSNVVNALLFSRQGFKYQPNYISRRSFIKERRLLKSSLAFHDSQRFLYGNNNREITGEAANGNSATALDAEIAFKFQALIRNELEDAQTTLENIKKQTIERSGYIALPIQSIDANKIKFSLRQVDFSQKEKLLKQNSVYIIGNWL